ncbi:hypothetical protein ACFJGW_18100 [Burkholderiaceae bacterium UC74_6]
MSAKYRRVLIANMPAMLSEILAAGLEDDSEIEVFISEEDPDFLSRISGLRPDIVIGPWSDWMRCYETQALQVYLMSSDARSLRHIELCSAGEDRDEASMDQLLAAIKTHKGH